MDGAAVNEVLLDHQPVDKKQCFAEDGGRDLGGIPSVGGFLGKISELFNSRHWRLCDGSGCAETADLEGILRYAFVYCSERPAVPIYCSGGYQ